MPEDLDKHGWWGWHDPHCDYWAARNLSEDCWLSFQNCEATKSLAEDIRFILSQDKWASHPIDHLKDIAWMAKARSGAHPSLCDGYSGWFTATAICMMIHAKWKPSHSDMNSAIFAASEVDHAPIHGPKVRLVYNNSGWLIKVFYEAEVAWPTGNRENYSTHAIPSTGVEEWDGPKQGSLFDIHPSSS